MPSIHPDYEYDIFISYRQNDNKRDGWVTNFVAALSDELEATLKNPVSIYFDENPHDGLLETHQVDASLAKKLKCLVFIPIISQTYCDETSFAWEHEFLPFVQMATEDELGMNIALSNGNVTSRVLPIKIHDLDSEDQDTVEAVLDGPLRSINFIYNEPGVNRPLKPNDDRNLNLEKTDYQNQINKVANALKDIGLSIINQSDGTAKVPTVKEERTTEVKSTKKGLAIGLGIIGLAMILYWGYTQFFNSSPPEVENITIAVLAFDDQSPEGDQEWLGDGMADEILNVLAKVNGLQVTGKTSSFSFKGKGVTTKVIGETLNVSTVLEGSVSKIGDKLKITAQLIDVETDAHIWSKTYERDYTEIFDIQNEVALSIAVSLKRELSVEALKEISLVKEVDPEAYEYFLKAYHFHDEFFSSYLQKDFIQAKEMFLRAIAINPEYLDALVGLAELHETHGYIMRTSPDDQRIRDSILNVAYQIDSESPYLFYYKGYLSNNYDSAFNFLKKAYDYDPYSEGYDLLVNKIQEIGLNNLCISLSKRYLALDPLNKSIGWYLASSLWTTGQAEDAKEQLIKLLDFDKDYLLANGLLFNLKLLVDRDTIEAKKIAKKLYQLDARSTNLSIREALILVVGGRKEEAFKKYSKENFIKLNDISVYEILGMKSEALAIIEQRINNQVNPYIKEFSYLSLKGNPHFNNIRNEPQFQQWLKEAKKVHEERVAKYGHLFDE